MSPAIVRRLLAGLIATLLVTLPEASSAQAASPTGGSVPEAAAQDVSSIDAVIAALYDVISGPAAQARDWGRFRSLFVPEARLIPTGFPPGSDRARARVLTLDDYVTQSGPILEQRGFFEREVGRVSERFENIAQVFSTYESMQTPDGEAFQRGVNSIQLMWDGERWWIVNIMWRGVPPEFEIPEKYLKSKK